MPSDPVVDSGTRFSGHESFVCRYGWLPKLYWLVLNAPSAVRDDKRVMIELGVGRNMVKSIRFWGVAFGLMETIDKDFQATEFADWLLAPKNGEDPYLEDIGSLWLLHWRITAQANLAAWNVGFYESPETELMRRFFMDRVAARAKVAAKRITQSTLKQHVDIFLNSYASKAINNTSPEESLGCPLQELGLMSLRQTGEKDDLIQFHRGPWQHLTVLTFSRLLMDYWELAAPNDLTISVRSILLDVASPGLVLRLDEIETSRLCREMAEAYTEVFSFSETIDRQSVELKTQSIKEAKRVLGYI